MPRKRANLVLRPRLRILRDDEVAFGPGKSDLLAMIESTGSIAQSAKKLGMSYMRAWKLIKTMNRCFKEPLVETDRGGFAHGGAVLTETGMRVRALYEEMERNLIDSSKRQWTSVRSLLRP